MKVILIDPSLFTWPYDLKLAEGLSSIGHIARVYGRSPDQAISPESEKYLDKYFYKSLQFRSYNRLPAKIQLVLKGLSHFGSMARLMSDLKKERPDVIHFQWAPLPIVDAQFLSSFKRAAPVILTVHDSNPFNNSPSSSLQRIGARKIISRFDHVIVHTSAARERLLDDGISNEKISIVPHGLLLNGFDRVTRAIELKKNRVEILLFGQIKPYKGIDVLIQAISLLPKQLRDKCLVKIVGRPFMTMQPLLALADKLGLRDQVEFDLRYVAEGEVPSLLANADIMVFPYREIDASGVFMLALAAGRPIVASNLGTFKELLGGSHLDSLVTPGSPEELAASLAPLIADPERRRLQSERMIALCNSVPSWAEIARVTANVYNRTMLELKKRHV